MRRLQVVSGVVVTLILFFIAVGLGADLQVRTGPDEPVEERCGSTFRPERDVPILLRPRYARSGSG